MDRPDVRSIMQELRVIRDVTVQELADAMSSRYSELGYSNWTEDVRPMTAEEIVRLEQSGECDVSHETLFLLSNVLGVAAGYVPWLVDLIRPNDHILNDPLFRRLDENAEKLATQQKYKPGERGFEDELPITLQQAKALFRSSGFVNEPEIRTLLLSRFIRHPFPAERYQVFVTALKDGDLYPFLSPGSIALVDTRRSLDAMEQPHMENPYYLCRTDKGHRCGWPIGTWRAKTLQTMDRDGTWHDLENATPIGVPVQITWNACPLERHDFWMQDHRDQDTLEFIREIRKMYPPPWVQ